MSFSRNWFGHAISQGERFVVQYLDRAFGGRIRQVFEVTPDGVDVTGNLDVIGGRITGDGSLSVAGFNSLATIPDSAPIQAVIGTDEIDFLATSSNTVFAGTIAGRYFLPVGVRFVITEINGTITTGPTTNVGNNVAKTNILTSAITMTASAMNTVNTNGAPALATALGPVLGTTLIDAGTSFKVDVTVAAVTNTATIAKGRIYLFGAWLTL